MEPRASDPVGPTHATHTVAEVMRPAVTMVETTGHLAAAAYLMNRANQSALVVVDDAERPMAIIAEADLMRAVAHGADTSHGRIAEWMNRDPQTVQPTTAMTEAARIMVDTGNRHLPVVSHDRVVGIVAISDIVSAFEHSVRLASAVVFVSHLARSIGFHQPLLRYPVTVRDVGAALLTGPSGSQLYLREVGDSSIQRSDGVGVQVVSWTPVAATTSTGARRCWRNAAPTSRSTPAIASPCWKAEIPTGSPSSSPTPVPTKRHAT